jgi:hypothetical protein
MSTPPPDRHEPLPHADHRWIFWAVGIVVVVLMVIGVITYNSHKDNQEAQQKAQQLAQKLEAAGLTAPVNQDTITRALGTDGGAVCDNPLSSLGKALLFSQLTNGAAFVGQRPIIVDRRVLQGEGLILQVYCPDKYEQYQDKINELKTDNVIKG